MKTTYKVSDDSTWTKEHFYKNSTIKMKMNNKATISEFGLYWNWRKTI